MSTNLESQSLQYLLVDVGGQLFAIPLRDVIAVQQRGYIATETVSMPPNNGGDEQVIHSFDLSKLFWNIETPYEQGAIVIIATLAGVCGLLVGHVYPASVGSAEQRQSLPFSLEHHGNVFAEVIIGPERPTLTMDCQRLVELIVSLAPECVASVEDAA